MRLAGLIAFAVVAACGNQQASVSSRPSPTLHATGFKDNVTSLCTVNLLKEDRAVVPGLVTKPDVASSTGCQYVGPANFRTVNLLVEEGTRLGGAPAQAAAFLENRHRNLSKVPADQLQVAEVTGLGPGAFVSVLPKDYFAPLHVVQAEVEWAQHGAVLRLVVGDDHPGLVTADAAVRLARGISSRIGS